jgi:hypothetical protein
VKNYRSNTCFSGIPCSEYDFCGHWRSPLGQCSSWFLRAAYFDAHGPQAAKDTSASQDKLIELFNHIERFFLRLEIYTGIPPTTAMMGIIIEIMVEVLTILAIATKEAKRGRFSELLSGRLRFLTDTLFRKVYEEVDREHRDRG